MKQRLIAWPTLKQFGLTIPDMLTLRKAGLAKRVSRHKGGLVYQVEVAKVTQAALTELVASARAQLALTAPDSSQRKFVEYVRASINGKPIEDFKILKAQLSAVDVDLEWTK